MREIETSDAAGSSSPAPRKRSSPLEILRAITEPTRYAVLQELADGHWRSVTRLAKQLDCHPDLMGRHLQRLRKAGLVRRVNPGPEADQRSKYYQIPTEYRATLPDGRRILDFGPCALIFDPPPQKPE